TGVSVPLSESGVVSAGTVLSAGALVVSTGVGPASAPASSCAAGTLPLSSSPQPTKVSALPSAIKANKFLVFNIGSLDSSRRLGGSGNGSGTALSTGRARSPLLPPNRHKVQSSRGLI